MNKSTQLQWVKDRLKEDGCVSRNGALKNYITRVAARVNDLRREGWDIVGSQVKTEHGKDYIYSLVNKETLF